MTCTLPELAPVVTLRYGETTRYGSPGLVGAFRWGPPGPCRHHLGANSGPTLNRPGFASWFRVGAGLVTTRFRQGPGGHQREAVTRPGGPYLCSCPSPSAMRIIKHTLALRKNCVRRGSRGRDCAIKVMKMCGVLGPAHFSHFYCAISAPSPPPDKSVA